MKYLNKNHISFIIIAVLFICCHAGCVSTDMNTKHSLLIPDDTIIEDTYEPGVGEPIGTVEAVQGEAFILHAAILRGYRSKKEPPEQEKELYAGILRGYRAKEGLPVFKEDSIIAGVSGLIRIRLNDESIMTLASNTEITIHDSLYDEAKLMRSGVISMNSGKARFQVTKLKDFSMSEFKVKTNTAIIKVIGSDFVIRATSNETEVTALVDTELKVVSINAPEKPAFIREFERTIIPEGGVPSDVEAVVPDDSEILKQFQFAPENSVEMEKESPVQPKKDAVFVSDEAIVPPANMGQAALPPESAEKEKVEPENNTAGDVRDMHRDISETITEEQKGKVKVSW